MIHDFGCAHDAEFRQVRSMLKKGAYDSHSDTDSRCFKSENVMSGSRPPGKASCCNFPHGWQVRFLPQTVTQARTVEGLRLGAVCLPIKRSGRQNACMHRKTFLPAKEETRLMDGQTDKTADGRVGSKNSSIYRHRSTDAYRHNRQIQLKVYIHVCMCISLVALI